MLFSDAFRHLLQFIKKGAQNNSAQIIQGVKDASTRPERLDSEGDKRRDYLEGQHQEHFRAFLRAIYPEGMARREINPVTVNYVKTQAETDADIYRVGEPVRLGGTEAATARLEHLTDEARTATILPDLEVKSNVSRTHFAKIQRNPSTHRLEITRHWPQNVWPVVDPSAPAELACCSAVLLKLAAKTYELWTAHEDDEGPFWTAVQLSEETDRPQIRDILTDKYRGRLPIVAMHTSAPDASPFVQDDGDLLNLANNYMLAWTDVFHLVRHQAHNPIWFSGVDDNVRFSGGPGAVSNLGHDGKMGSLDTKAQIDESLSLINDFSGAVARSRTQSPRAYLTNPQPLNSGVALRVDNQITEEKRPQRIELMRQFEQFDLLPVLDEVDRLQPPPSRNPLASPLPIDWSQVKVIFPPAPTIEDMSQKQNRLVQAIDAALVTRARAAVEAGYYEDEDTAHEAIKDLEPVATEPIPEAPARGPTEGALTESP